MMSSLSGVSRLGNRGLIDNTIPNDTVQKRFLDEMERLILHYVLGRREEWTGFEDQQHFGATIERTLAIYVDPVYVRTQYGATSDTDPRLRSKFEF